MLNTASERDGNSASSCVRAADDIDRDCEIALGGEQIERHWIDRPAVNEYSPVDDHRCEHAGQGHAGLNRREERAVIEDDFLPAPEIGGDDAQRDDQLFESLCWYRVKKMCQDRLRLQ